MKERPILFSAPMVRAILAGSKTQTRRVVKPQPSAMQVGWHWVCKKLLAGYAHTDAGALVRLMRPHCPYGQPGDRLWVRETCVARELPDGLDGVQFLADMAFQPIANTKEAADEWVKLNHYGGRGRGHVVPAIHMPRWASRITLEVTGVRVERLQDISEADAEAEGTLEWAKTACAAGNPYGLTAGGYFECLWSSINGRESWDANPWVWVLEFKRVTP